MFNTYISTTNTDRKEKEEERGRRRNVYIRRIQMNPLIKVTNTLTKLHINTRMSLYKNQIHIQMPIYYLMLLLKYKKYCISFHK